MAHLHTSIATIFCIAFAMVGCIGTAEVSDTPVPQPDDNGTGSGDVPLQPQGFEYANGLLPSCFWATGTQKTLRQLGNGALADANGMMPQMPNMSALCHQAIEYAVQCALDDTQTVTNPHDNSHPYRGAVGLATNWRTQALDEDGRRWVTACMLQRLNALGVEVPILLEGNHPSLYENPAQDATYPHQESVAYGDLFSSTAALTGLTPAFTAYACGEEELADVCIDPAAILRLRLCDNLGLLCGVKYIGKCSSQCMPDGPYWNCSGYSQTIRVQTKESFCL